MCIWGGQMSFRKSLGIIAFCTQAVVAVDYNMQVQKAGLGPGELSMKAYAAIVQARYDKPERAALDASVAQEDSQKGWDRLAQFGTALTGRATDTAAKPPNGATPEQPKSVCIRRGNALNC